MSTSENKEPFFALYFLKDLFTFVKDDYHLYLGYCAWLLIPAGLLFARTFFSNTPVFWFDGIMQIISVFIGAWVNICITLIASLRSKSINISAINIDNISTYAWKTAPSFLLLELGIAIAAGIGFSVFLIPGMIIIAFTMFAQFPLILEGKSVISSLKASFALVKKQPLRLFFALLFGNICIGIVPMLLLLGTVVTSLQMTGGTIQQFLLNTPAWFPLCEEIVIIPVLPLLVLFPFVIYEKTIKQQAAPTNL